MQVRLRADPLDPHGANQVAELVSLALVADVTAPGDEGYEAARSGAEMAAAFCDPATVRLARILEAIGMIAQDPASARDQALVVRDSARGPAMRS